MTPEERTLAAAWVQEMWPTVREYHDGDPLPKRPTKRRARRRGGNGENVVDSGEKRSA